MEYLSKKLSPILEKFAKNVLVRCGNYRLILNKEYVQDNYIIQNEKRGGKWAILPRKNWYL